MNIRFTSDHLCVPKTQGNESRLFILSVSKPFDYRKSNIGFRSKGLTSGYTLQSVASSFFKKN